MLIVVVGVALVILLVILFAGNPPVGQQLAEYVGNLPMTKTIATTMSDLYHTFGSKLAPASYIVTYSKLGQNGRLGNQLFQIACVLGVAEKKSLRAAFAREWEYNDYFEASLPLLSISERLSLLNNTTVAAEANPIDYEEIPYPRFNTVLDIDGYRQSEHYFAHARSTVFRYLTPKKAKLDSIRQTLETTAGQSLDKCIAVHFRLGDYQNNIEHQVCKPVYYIAAIKRQLHLSSSEKLTVVLFSDNLGEASGILAENHIAFVCSPFSKEMDDLLGISACRYKVLSNSSFSWWASYLNRDFYERTIAPTPWFGETGNLSRFNQQNSVHRAKWQILEGKTGRVVRARSLTDTFMTPITANAINAQVTVSGAIQCPVFVISMPNAKGKLKLANAQKLLTQCGLENSNHLLAVVGKTIAPQDALEAGIISKQFDLGAPIEVLSGTIGCMLSHMAFWTWLVNQNTYDHAVIFEDDIMLDARVTNNQQIPQYINAAIKAMPEDWSVLFLGSCICDCEQYVPQSIPYLVKTERSLCTHAYVVSKHGARTFLANLPQEKGVDTFMHVVAQQMHMQCFDTNPSWFWQDVAQFKSDIRNSTMAATNNQQCK